MKTKKNKIEGAAPDNAATNPLDSSTWTQEQVDLIKADIRAVCDAIERGDYLALKRAKLAATKNQVFAKSEIDQWKKTIKVQHPNKAKEILASYGDTRELDEERIEREFNQTLGAIRLEWPTAADWNVVTDEHVEILDADEKVLAVITAPRLDYYFSIGDDDSPATPYYREGSD